MKKVKHYKRLFSVLICIAIILTGITIQTSPIRASTTWTWPSDQAFPSFGTPASVLDAVDVGGKPFDTQIAAITFQGIVNRTQPRLLVFNSAEEGSQRTWPDAMGLTYNYTTDLDGIISKYRNEINGVIIYDDAYMDTTNVATTLAGIYGAIVISPSMVSRFSYLPVIKDLRGICGTNKIAIYNWLYNNYRPGNSYGNPSYGTRLFMSLSPNGHVASRDLASALAAPVLWLDPGIESERVCIAQFVTPNLNFDKASSTGNPFFGGWWPNEDNGIRWATQQGIPTVPSDNFENYTVYSGLSRQIQAPTVPAKPALEKKIYVSFMMSDGDNIAYSEHAMRVGRLWGDPNRGNVPIGWTISPVLLDAAPQMLNYYCKTATANDELICGPNGAGYTRSADWVNSTCTTFWPNTTFASNYAKMTNSYFEKMPLSLVTIWRTMSPDQYNAYCNVNVFPTLMGTAVMEENSSSGDRTLKYSGDIPIMYEGAGTNFTGINLHETIWNADTYDSDTSTNSAAYINLTKNAGSFNTTTSQPRFFLCQFSVWSANVSPTNLMNLMNSLNAAYPGKFEFVRPDQLVMLINEYNGKSYNTALRAPATASSTDSGSSPSNAVDGSAAPTNGWKSSTSGDKWLSLDLGRNYTLNRYVVKNAETGYFANNLNTKDFRIQVSTNGTTWTDADIVTGNTSAIVYRNLSSVTARYVRLYITNAGADGIARIQDFEVYGAVPSQTNNYSQEFTAKFADPAVNMSNDVCAGGNPRSRLNADGTITCPTNLDNAAVWGMYPAMKANVQYYAKTYVYQTGFDSAGAVDSGNIGYVRNSATGAANRFGSNNTTGNVIGNQGKWVAVSVPLPISSTDINMEGKPFQEITINLMRNGNNSVTSFGHIIVISTNSTPLTCGPTASSPDFIAQFSNPAVNMNNDVCAGGNPRSTLNADGTITCPTNLDNAVVWGMYPAMKANVQYYAKTYVYQTGFDSSNAVDSGNIGYVRNSVTGAANRFGSNNATGNVIGNQGKWVAVSVPLPISSTDINMEGTPLQEITINLMRNGNNSVTSFGHTIVISTDPTFLTCGPTA